MIEEFNDLNINEFEQRLDNSVTENLTISCRKCGNLKVFKALFSWFPNIKKLTLEGDFFIDGTIIDKE